MEGDDLPARIDADDAVRFIRHDIAAQSPLTGNPLGYPTSVGRAQIETIQSRWCSRAVFGRSEQLEVGLIPAYDAALRIQQNHGRRRKIEHRVELVFRSTQLCVRSLPLGYFRAG
jgi:hypothetical protein